MAALRPSRVGSYLVGGALVLTAAWLAAAAYAEFLLLPGQALAHDSARIGQVEDIEAAKALIDVSISINELNPRFHEVSGSLDYYASSMSNDRDQGRRLLSSAIAKYNKTVQMTPESGVAWGRLSLACLMAGQWRDCGHHAFTSAYKLSPYDYDAQRMYVYVGLVAWSLLDEGERHAVRRGAEHLASLQPRYVLSLVHRTGKKELLDTLLSSSRYLSSIYNAEFPSR